MDGGEEELANQTNDWYLFGSDYFGGVSVYLVRERGGPDD